MSLPTLGCAYFDRHKVVQIVGGPGTPPPAGMFAEAELRALLRKVDELRSDNPSFGGMVGMCPYVFNPQACIDIMNTLLTLGKVKALAVLSEYVRLTDGGTYPDGVYQSDVVFWIDRAPFTQSDYAARVPNLTSNNQLSRELTDESWLPVQPIVMVDDVPLVVNFRRPFGGYLKPAADDLAYFQNHGVLRSRPLTPPVDPFSIPNKVEQMCLEAQADLGRDKSWPLAEIWDAEQSRLIQEEIIMLVDPSLVPVKRARIGVTGPTDRGWSAAQLEMHARGFAWNRGLNRYSSPDGSYAPDVPPVHYAHNFRRPSFGLLNVEFDICRDDPNSVGLAVSYDLGREFKQRVTFRILGANSGAYPPTPDLESDSADSKGQDATCIRDLQLAPGSKIQVLATSAGVTQSSPVYTP